MPAIFNFAKELGDDGRWLPGILNTVLLVGCIGLDIVLLFVLLPFVWFHYRMACKNHTSVDGDRFPQYDLGLHGNLASVLGRERWTWLIPMYLRGPDGDGVHWPTRDGGRVGTATSLADEAQAHSQTASASHVHPGIRELSPRGELDPAQCSLPAGHSLGNLPATASQVSATSSTSR